MKDSEFFAALDAAILSGRSSGDISKEYGIRTETIRRRRSALKRAGHIIDHPIHISNTRRDDALGVNHVHDRNQ